MLPWLLWLMDLPSRMFDLLRPFAGEEKSVKYSIERISIT